MPTYAYACKDCGHAFDTVQSFSEDSLTECPQCHGLLRKKFNSVGVVFKGSGFYRNDSRNSFNGSSPATKDSTSGTKAGGSDSASTSESSSDSSSGTSTDSSSTGSSVSSGSSGASSAQKVCTNS
ncbi:MAG: FmdB family transcriptional regulator [Micrococcaceae bacterium]|nr:FmdB family transcriptional regulator [Micrococcaceae bacterium]